MEFNKNKYRVYDWKHWMMVHWMLNPGLAFNELILGQRVLKVMLEDKTLDKPRYERSFIPCPHCETLHDGRTWSFQKGTAFKNWFGLYCPSCGGVIPCLTNVTTFLILALTFPLWGWFRKPLKAAWLAKQPERFKAIDISKEPNPYIGKSWIATGLAWGFIMFLLTELFNPVVFGNEITSQKLLIRAAIWIIGGLLFGYINKQYSEYREKRKRHT